VDGVVHVVVPLPVQPVPAALARGDQPGVVLIGLRHQRQRPPEVRRERLDLHRQLLQQVHGRAVVQRVHGVQPQGVHVELVEPPQRVVDDVPPHLARLRPVQVESRPPRSVRGGEVRPELRQVVPRRPQMVVHHVQAHAQTATVARVDELLERVRPAVRLVHREPRHPVVTPAVLAVERVQRHHLDHVHAQLHQLVQVLDRAGQGAAGGEGAHVHLIEHRPRQPPTRPRGVGPAGGVHPVHPREPVHAVRLTRRPRVGTRGARLVVVAGQHEPVVPAHLPRHAGRPPAVLRSPHGDRLGAGGVQDQADRAGSRRPDGERVVARGDHDAQGRENRAATGAPAPAAAILGS
jgi:hypothetical protein